MDLALGVLVRTVEVVSFVLTCLDLEALEKRRSVVREENV